MATGPQHIDLRSFADRAADMRRPFHDSYLAMYSTVFDGIVTDPVLMMLPIDDHMVHRGDGIFEVFKCIAGNIYNLKAHLTRLQKTAAALSFTLPMTMAKLTHLIAATIKAGGKPECYIHLYLSRGPGSFGVNPYDCPATQCYVVVTSAKKPFMEEHPEGARVGISSISVKPAFYAGVKSCNYLPNVLMRREAANLGVDFVAAFDENGYLAEGSTENFGIISEDSSLLFPRLDRILAGTTMLRVAELGQKLVDCGDLRRVAFEDISPDAISRAKEILVVGTTPNVTHVAEFDGKPVGSANGIILFQKLSALLAADMACNLDMLTPVM